MKWDEAPFVCILIALAIAGLLLSGCARRGPAPTPTPTRRSAAAPTAIATVRPTTVRPTSTPTSSFVPTVIASVEKTVTVGPHLVDCPEGGAGGGKCYLVKEEGESEYTVFLGKIEGLTYWPDAEYTMIVREDKLANPPPGSPDVMWTVLKGLYTIPVAATPAAAP